MCLLTAWARSLHTGCLLSNNLCHDALESPHDRPLQGTVPAAVAWRHAHSLLRFDAEALLHGC